ncbi:MAG TPA: topoisomerase C-terminal repeat-containing protein, partial [Acetobacteraceae bacterium]|nr:topoisomerase C-terminal repeat-containing protein [Acetobacteraceae bacterium]
DEDVLAVGLNRALDLLAKARAKVRELGPHPKDAIPVVVRKGRFGPYVQHGSQVANLPRDVGMEEITLEEAVALVAEKGKALKPRGFAARRGARGKANGGAAEAAAPAKAAPKAVAKPKAAAKKKPASKPKAPARSAAKPPTRRAAG